MDHLDRTLAFDHLPCDCGGTKWLKLIEPGDAPGSDLRTFECPRCSRLESHTFADPAISKVQSETGKRLRVSR